MKKIFKICAILLLCISCDPVEDDFFMYVKNTTDKELRIHLTNCTERTILPNDSVCVLYFAYPQDELNDMAALKFFLFYSNYDTVFFTDNNNDTIQMYNNSDTSQVNSFYRLSNWECVKLDYDESENHCTYSITE